MHGLKVRLLLLVAMFGNGKNQSVRIRILRDANSERFFGRLNAPHLMLKHAFVELVNIGNSKPGTAGARPGMGWSSTCVLWSCRMQSKRRTLSNELSPAGAFEFEREPHDIPVKLHRLFHVADGHNGVV